MEAVKYKEQRGFTLIELLVVIGILAILAAAVIIAVNPARQFAQARNAQRRTNVLAILNAVHQNAVDNRGVFNLSKCPATALPTTATPITDGVGGVDLCTCLVPTYISLLPLDPSAGSGDNTCAAAYDSGYNILQDATTTRITVSAPNAELGETISVTR